MKVKTYGVPGLTEWYGKVKAGTLETTVSFTGGTASPGGAQPAYFMTKDPIVQFVIENCKEFKDGFIILVMQQEVPGEHPRMAIPKPLPPKTATIPNAANGGTTEVERTQDGGTATDDQQPTDDPLDDLPLVIDVADKTEAIEYLKEHYPDRNYTATSLRTKAAFDAACNECGVRFIYTA